ncbi:hypothetical protein FHL15_006374 [Xylaria flabelliformis]|uniref:Uncharacterized protein n=1 Tax=Xylaria flabelliformis TaxID=2512241 RepID=A0A553HXL7_9PEZI|nr:hypothetical protein FHL15_006374 [Xylaria flabelliformis]
MSNPMPQEERENLARTISNIWGTLVSPNITAPISTAPISATHASATPASTVPASTDPPSTTSSTSAPTAATSHTSDSPAGDASTSDEPHIDVRHDSCQLKMSLNTDALAADISRRDDRHEERIPCRRREVHEGGQRVEQEAPNFVFGDAARQQSLHLPSHIQYSNSSTRVRIRDIDNRQVGLNLGTDGRSLGLTLGGAPGIGTWQLFLTVDVNAIVVVFCVLLVIWLLKG